VTKLSDDFALSEFRGMVTVPGARYTSREFFDLEMERLWPRVWQVACREEEIPNPGDFLEYTIGDQSILVVRSEQDTITAFFNACAHRGTRLRRAQETSPPPRSVAATMPGAGTSRDRLLRSSTATTIHRP
jgi:hypothetical protein